MTLEKNQSIEEVLNERIKYRNSLNYKIDQQKEQAK